VALKDLLGRSGKGGEALNIQPLEETVRAISERENFFYEVKQKIHSRLIEEANLSALDTLNASEIRPEIASLVDYNLSEEKVLLNEEERNAQVLEIHEELMGQGPIEPFFKDPTDSDILCKTKKNNYE
jgi:pilus assembly protein CpaF